MEQHDLLSLEWEGEYTHYRQVYAEAYERMVKGRALLWLTELKNADSTRKSLVIGQIFVQLVCDRPELADGVLRAYIYSFRVRSEYRGAGLGTFMVQFIERDLARRGFLYATLNVSQQNYDAQRLYQRLGYCVVDSEAGHWSYQDIDGRWHTVDEPAWRMEKRLEP